uniref:Uncharacterized protein n=1 Tax=Sphaerodactylus townsendi TaxID=933632 RepID=A0ACB8FTE8_9SAUR
MSACCLPADGRLEDPEDPQICIRNLEECLHQMEMQASQAKDELEHHLQLQMELERETDRTVEDEWDLQELLTEKGLEATRHPTPLDFNIWLQEARDQGRREFCKTQGATLEQVRLEFQQARDHLREDQERQCQALTVAADQERQALFQELQQDCVHLQEERNCQQRNLTLAAEKNQQELLQECQHLLELKEQHDMDSAAIRQADAARAAQLDQLQREQEALQRDREDLQQ